MVANATTLHDAAVRWRSVKTTWTIMPDMERSLWRIRAQIVGSIRQAGSVQLDPTVRYVLWDLVGRKIPAVTARPKRIIKGHPSRSGVDVGRLRAPGGDAVAAFTAAAVKARLTLNTAMAHKIMSCVQRW